MKKTIIFVSVAAVLAALALIPNSDSAATRTTGSTPVAPAPDVREADVSRITGEVRLPSGSSTLFVRIYNGDTEPIKDVTIAITDDNGTRLYRETYSYEGAGKPLQPQSVGELRISVLAPTGDWTWRVVSATRYMWYLDDPSTEEEDMSGLDYEPRERRP